MKLREVYNFTGCFASRGTDAKDKRSSLHILQGNTVQPNQTQLHLAKTSPGAMVPSTYLLSATFCLMISTIPGSATVLRSPS